MYVFCVKLPLKWTCFNHFFNLSFYLGVFWAVVFCCILFSVNPQKKPISRTTMKVLTFQFNDESKFPECRLGLEKNGKGILDFFEDFHIPNSQTCRFFRETFDRFYSVRISTSTLQLDPPSEFLQKMKAWMHNKADLLDQVTSQKIIRFTNKLTGEETLMNSVRDKRPVPESSSAKIYLDKLIENSRENCDFCDYQKNTAMDTFGRIETEHSYTMANAFKLDKFHSMVVMRTHDPINWNFAEFIDAFDVIQQWFKKVLEIDSGSIYHHVYWDMFPKAGGSQIHPHIHMTANSQGFHGALAIWESAALQYSNQNPGRNFYEDLVYLHDQLGLVTRLGKAAAVAHINPRKDNELLIMGQSGDPDFYRLLHSAVRVYMDEMKLYSFSMVITFPTEESKGHTPILARMATRGDVSERRSDVSSLELFSAANVNSDPMKIARWLRRYVEKLPVSESDQS